MRRKKSKVSMQTRRNQRGNRGQDGQLSAQYRYWSKKSGPVIHLLVTAPMKQEGAMERGRKTRAKEVSMELEEARKRRKIVGLDGRRLICCSDSVSSITDCLCFERLKEEANVLYFV